MKAGVIGAVILSCLVRPALADDCDRVVAAIVKTDHAPHYDLSTDADTGTRVQEIFTGQAIYIKAGNEDWRSDPKTGDELEADFRRAHEDAKWSCQTSGTEAIGGETADIIAVHHEDNPSEPDSRYWISQSSGLLLKMVIYASLGRHIFQVTDTYDYKNIPAPPE